LVEFIELPGHPFWVATQAHPEFKSRPDRAHPLFRELIRASLAYRDATPPGLRRMLNEAADEADTATTSADPGA
jgi:CTP synthase